MDGTNKTASSLYKKQEPFQVFVVKSQIFDRQLPSANLHDRYGANSSDPCCDDKTDEGSFYEWMCIPVEECTWNKWEDHFNNIFNELKELNAITAKWYGYEVNNIMH